MNLEKIYSDTQEESGSLKANWMKMLCTVAETPSSSTQFSGIKYLADFHYSMPGKAFLESPDYNLSDLGYASPGTAKMNQLMRNYLDEESIAIAGLKLHSREKQEFTSVIINTQAKGKSSKSQGHCMVGIVLTKNSKKVKEGKIYRISVMYRMTESIRKFGADLLFFQDILFPAILGDEIDKLDTVNFHFANLSFSPLFFPIVMDKIDLRDFMKKLEENMNCHRAVLGVIRRDMEHEEGFHAFRTRNIMQNIAHKTYKNHPEIKETLKELIREHGKEVSDEA